MSVSTEAPDPLSELLRVAGVRGSLISHATLGGRYGVLAPSQPRAIFHVPVRGTAWVRCGERAVCIGPGDVVVIPRGASHIVSDAEVRAPTPIERFSRDVRPGTLPRLHNDVDDPPLDLLCGTYTLGAPADRWITQSMPELFVVRGASSTERYLAATVELLAGEITGGGAGATIVSDRLVEVLVVHVLRGWARQAGNRHPGWLTGIADAQIGRVLRAVHESPADAWSLPSMAKTAGMSRTRFVQRFTERVGCPPGTWLIAWRMAVAKRSLRDGKAVSEAAASAGYASEASFSRAFKRIEGRTPSSWRAEAG